MFMVEPCGCAGLAAVYTASIVCRIQLLKDGEAFRGT